jgi:uncharacterized protein YdeI (YjbR/CyaY-like superfamily)
MNPLFFENAAALGQWFAKNHRMEKELIVGYYKVGSGKPSVSWPDSVDEALRFGWIDGVRNSIDADSYKIRFTPRKPTSMWSVVNIAKVEALIAKGLMEPEGLAAYAICKDNKAKIYGYKKEATELPSEYQARFVANEAAWLFFKAQPPGYKQQMIHRIIDAKTKATQLSRLDKLIAASETGKRLL